MTPSRTRKGSLVLGVALSLFACSRFERKHVPVEQVAELGYPTCDGRIPGEGEVVAESLMRSGPTHPDPTIVEHFSLRRRECLWTASVRQEWPMGTADVEVVYDASLLPLRVWKRMTLPGLPDPLKTADIRRYELRSSTVELKRRNTDGRVDFRRIKSGRPLAVIGPGRGLLTMWIRRAKLAVGQKVREPALDVRGFETIMDVTLLREPDMTLPQVGPVQVYTFYGRETVFADAQGTVIGDLAGMRPDRALSTPRPPPIPMYGPIDPVGTP